MQYRITKPSKLLNKHGELIQKGYATSPILKYNRDEVARKLRLKEWDYYLIYNDEYSLSVTIGKSVSLLLISVSLIDFHAMEERPQTVIKLVSKRKFTMPKSSLTGDITYQDKKIKLSIKPEENQRRLFFSIKNAKDDIVMEVSMLLFQEPKDSMVIATPFKECDKDFYYNRKIIGMRASGNVKYKEQVYTFSPCSSFGLLDWGRGVWPYKTTWYWSAAQGEINGNVFGFNLGYGFGDTSAATENMLFFNGIASKLTNVTFHIRKNSLGKYEYDKPWIITSSDQRIEMHFTPIYDRSLNLSLLVLSTNQHQVFGRFSGWAILDDGSIIILKNFFGFAERVENRW